MLVPVFVAVVSAPCAGPETVFVSFDGKAGSTVTENVRSGEPKYDAATPDKYTYDPLSGRSRVNGGSLRLDGGKGRSQVVGVSLPSEPPSGFTLEFFAKPEGIKGESGQFLPIVTKTRRSEKAATCRLGVWTSYPGHVYDWLQAGFTAPGKNDEQRLEWTRYGGMTMLGRENPWRHYALVFDPSARRVTYYLDYTPLASAPAGSLTWDAGELQVGGTADGNCFRGLIDEVRLTPKPLTPDLFLHATPHVLRDVSLASPEGKLPRGTNYADIRIRFGAVGDGKTDDTHAFRKAFRDLADATHIVGHQTLYIPDGTYLVSDTIRFSRYLVIQGQSRDRTVIKLTDSNPKFSDPKKPRPLLSSGFEDYEVNIKNRRGGNMTHGNYVFDLTLDTGKGNPGAIGFDYQGHNNSAVSNLLIRGDGVHGLDLLRPWPGPCLVKDVTIEGFDHGVRAGWNEYSVTFSRLTLRGQRVAGISNGSNGLCIEGLVSENRVPAVVNGKGGQVVLIDAKLTGGDPATEAVINAPDASLYLRNVTIEGYAGKSVAEFTTAAGGKSLGLAVAHPPSIPWGTLKDWVNVRDYEHLVTPDGDWSAAIQAAIDSGAKTVYFPVVGTGPIFTVKKPVHVRGNVVRLFGMRNGVGEDAKALGGRPAFVFDGKQAAVSVERLFLPSALHASPCDLLVTCGGINKLDAAAGCGRLFLEDFLEPLVVNKHQRVWARHLNLESRETKIVNDGGQLWVLGYKTEEIGLNLLNRNGARTEILGGLIYVTDRLPPGAPLFENRDSDVSLIHLTSGYVGFPETYCREVRGDKVRNVPLNEVQTWHNGRPLTHLYTSSR